MTIRLTEKNGGGSHKWKNTANIWKDAKSKWQCEKCELSFLHYFNKMEIKEAMKMYNIKGNCKK